MVHMWRMCMIERVGLLDGHHELMIAGDGQVWVVKQACGHKNIIFSLSIFAFFLAFGVLWCNCSRTTAARTENHHRLPHNRNSVAALKLPDRLLIRTGTLLQLIANLVACFWPALWSSLYLAEHL